MMNLNQIKQEINATPDLKALDVIYRKYLGRKGELTLELRKIGEFPKNDRANRAPEAQSLKKSIEDAIFEKSGELKARETEKVLKDERIDVTAPGKPTRIGHLNPLTLIQEEANDLFSSLGFEIVEGPEVETEWYNFDALNIQKDHPARDMWDTFWLRSSQKILNPKSEIRNKSQIQNSKSKKLLLRTHTSPVQARYMEKNEPPLRIIVPGRSFRHEASDASHSWQFYQLEGLMVDRDINVANFKAVVDAFLRGIFGDDTSTRLRPSYFPFVEPGFEVDMECTSCTKLKIKNKKEKINCSVCKGTGWLEMMGAGMVHPNVFRAVGYNPGLWQGFAFGVGVDRIAMMKYKIDDIRLLYEGDLRFLRQF